MYGTTYSMSSRPSAQLRTGAGTTAVNAEPPTVQPRALMTAPISSANLSAKGRRQGGPS